MTTEDKTSKMSEAMAANASKGALLEKLAFAAIPIMFTCVVYLLTALQGAKNEILVLENKVAVVVNNDNKAIPPQGTTIDMAQIREALSLRIDQVEKDSAMARANMTLDRQTQLAEIEKQRLNMMAEAAVARAAIKAEAAAATQALSEKLGDRIDALNADAAAARAKIATDVAILQEKINKLENRAK
jgi:hypothetical protein